MKFCTNCGSRNEDDAAFCTNCGNRFPQAVPQRQDPAPSYTPYSQTPSQPYGASAGYQQQYRSTPQQYAPQTAQSAPTYSTPQYSAQPAYYNPPAIQLRTNRSLLKYILLSLITFGIYGLVVMSHISEEINSVAERHDGKHTMHFCLIIFVFSWLTLGIVPLVWQTRLSNRIGNELSYRGINYRFSGGTFWGWGILGMLILVGPFIYTHKLLKAMNLINADYNRRG